VGLRLGEIVYDGPPAGLTAEVLTQIYGEEDWSATVGKLEEDVDEEAADHTIPLQPLQPDRDRMAGLT
jgi:phosphonate transport system ATP-binding protein